MASVRDEERGSLSLGAGEAHRGGEAARSQTVEAMLLKEGWTAATDASGAEYYTNAAGAQWEHPGWDERSAGWSAHVDETGETYYAHEHGRAFGRAGRTASDSEGVRRWCRTEEGATTPTYKSVW